MSISATDSTAILAHSFNSCGCSIYWQDKGVYFVICLCVLWQVCNRSQEFDRDVNFCPHNKILHSYQCQISVAKCF